MATENIILGGDFNLVMDPRLDRVSGMKNNPKATEAVKAFIDQYDLCDIWRVRNTERKAYTWFKKSDKCASASRIDYLFVNTGLSAKVHKVDISLTTRSDHSLISLDLIDNDQPRGPGIWRGNNRLLNSERYCTYMSNSILQSIANTTRSELGAIGRWEYLKSQCKKKSQEFSKNSSREKSQLLINLNRVCQELQQESVEKQYNSNMAEVIHQVKERIREIEDDRTRGAIFRSRCKWANLGEKMSKYYFSLEKRNSSNKTMFTVILNDGTLCKQQGEILKEQQKFYSNLYTTDPEIVFTLENKSGIRLTKDQKMLLEGDIKWEEIESALSSMEGGKVCGCDGLSILFYKKFLNILKEPLWEMYKEVMATGCFGVSSRKGVITLLPKPGKDVRRVKNLRPITLLNTNFKVLAKAVAIRLKLVLPSIIGPQQTGFMSR